MKTCRKRALGAAAFATLAFCAIGLQNALAQSTSGQAAAVSINPAAGTNAATDAGSPVRLRQPQGSEVHNDESDQGRSKNNAGNNFNPLASPYVPGEFERFVQRQAGSEVQIRRLGAELITGEFDSRGGELSPLVPTDYLLGPGDEVILTLWGSVDADLRLMVDRTGRISIPRVGTIQVAGLRYSELTGVIERRVAQVFRNFQISCTLGQLRGIRVFTTGFVQRPGTYTLSSLSTVVAALMQAGGPSPAGSFRQVELRRAGKLVATYDLYDLLLKGDRSADLVVQAGDVVHVGPVGTQVGVIGSVNRPVVAELKAGETLADALRLAGGFSAVADRSRLVVERLQDRAGQRVVQLELPRDESSSLSHGDLIRALSATDAALSTQLQNKRIRVEGEVARPGDFVLPPSSTLADALKAAGGLTPAAFIYGVHFSRETVRLTQVQNYDRALRDLETELARGAVSQRVSSGEEAAAQDARTTATTRLVQRLRSLQPSGRVVLQVSPGSQELPDLLLEDGDRLHIPSKPTSVGVFGSVFNTGSYLYMPGRSLGEYLRLAGGPTKGADAGSLFVVRANGQVISSRQESSWFSRNNPVMNIGAEPGDTVFVPEEMDKTTAIQIAKDWTQILYQFGLGIAGIATAIR